MAMSPEHMPRGWMPTGDWSICSCCGMPENDEWTNVDGRFLRGHGKSWRGYLASGSRVLKDWMELREAMMVMCEFKEEDR